MNIFTENLHSEDMDQYYILTRDEDYREETREVIQKIWNKLTKLELIGDDLEKFVKDAQRNFHGALWQLELTYILKQKFNLLSPKKIGPDIIIENGYERIIIDCVSSNISGKNKVKRITSGAETINQDVRKLRVIESITKKYNSYKKWIDKGIINTSDKFIIAVDTSNLPDANLVGYPLVNIMKTILYGYGKQVFVLNHETGSFEIKYHKETEIEKYNKSRVSTNIFEDSKFGDISGIIWKNTNFFSEHSLTGKNLSLFKNPISNRKIDIEFEF